MKDKPIRVRSKGASGAIDALFRTYGLTFDQVDRRAMVFKKGTRGRGISVQTGISEAEADDADDRSRGINLADEHHMDVEFKPMSLRLAIRMLAQSARLQLIFDPEMESRLERTRVAVSLRDVTAGQALRYLLDAYDLKYQEIDGIAIKIVSEHDDHSSTR